MSSTIYAANRMLNYEFGGTSYTPPATWYFGLSTTSTGYSGSSATEPTDGAYARVALTNNKTNFSTSSSGSLINNVDIVFNQSSGSFGTIVDLDMWDLGAGGNIWHYQALSSPRIVSGSSVVKFLAGSLSISMAP